MRQAVSAGLSSRDTSATFTGLGIRKPNQVAPMANEMARSTAAQLLPALGTAQNTPLLPHSITPSTIHVICAGMLAMKAGAGRNSFEVCGCSMARSGSKLRGTPWAAVLVMLVLTKLCDSQVFHRARSRKFSRFATMPWSRAARSVKT